VALRDAQLGADALTGQRGARSTTADSSACDALRRKNGGALGSGLLPPERALKTARNIPIPSSSLSAATSLLAARFSIAAMMIWKADILVTL